MANPSILLILSRIALPFVFVLIQSTGVYAQSDVPITHHCFSGMMAFAFVPHAIEGNEERNVLIVPTVGVNYNYWLNEKWGLGLHLDVILQQYAIDRGENEIRIERSFPIAVTPVLNYSVTEAIICLVGAGIEYDSNETFGMATAGIEYGFEFRPNWELNFSGTFDYRFEAYTSFLFGISFSYLIH